ncbi:hypothetical protein KJS94_13600 [Flavihumibacter rivuli]|uniref:VOC family protein n=1 Tax=Flavihumibacter rivuli TaxID=2838156 RepID=UPI001BDE9569|nr:hypothetical protein [Flavihumibacter rivuli]ULQ55679.1 hypothetical protein KJS94_13600 [Flavihumibacter rivuli]
MLFHSVTFQTKNLEAQLQFYADIMGLPVIERNDQSFTVAAGNSLLRFDHHPEKPEGLYHFAFNVRPQSIWTSFDFLVERKIQPLELNGETIFDFIDWNAKAVYFRDADNNILEFIGRFNLATSSDQPGFSIADIINISEVGIPVGNIPETLSILAEKTGAGIWKENGDSFKAVGDEYGLLITVSTARNWFPTGDPSATLPISIILGQQIPAFEVGPYRFSGNQQ